MLDLADVIGCFEAGFFGDPLLEFDPVDDGLHLRWGER